MTAPADLSMRVDRARWWALTSEPFYGSLLMRLETVFGTSLHGQPVQTAATDGRRLALNPDFVRSLSDEELRFVLLHEALHCGHLHPWRLPSDERGNTAGDHEINLTLSGANGAPVKGAKMPAGGLCDPAYRGLACEEILARLPQPPPGGGGSGGGGGGPGKPDPCGSFCSPQDGPPGQSSGEQAAQAQQLREEWENAVIQAAQAAQALGKGSIPADMARQLDRIRAQGIDWRRELADFMRESVSHRSDWTRPARRHAWQPVIHPRRRRADELSRLVVVRDTSGSISDQLAAEFSAVVDDCTAETSARVLLLDCDAAIQAEYELEPGDACPRRAAGGGGTSFIPPMVRAAALVEAGERIAGMIYFTDLAGTFPEAPPEFPVLWINTSRGGAAPFGRTVDMPPMAAS